MNLYSGTSADIIHLFVGFTLYANTIDAVLFAREKYFGKTLSDRRNVR